MADTINLPLEDNPAKLDEHGPLIITGCPRSGTTFLSTSINAIPGIEQFNGVLAPPRMMHMIGKRYAEGISVDTELRVMRDILWNAFIRRSVFFNERVGAVVRSRRGLFALARPGTVEGRTLLYKEPFLAFAIEPIAEHFGSARFVHIVRDGRDNADSLARSYPDALSDAVLADPALSLEKNSEIGLFDRVDGFNFPWWVSDAERDQFRGATAYVRNVLMWREMTRRIVAAGRTLPADRFLQIRYEDMIRDSEATADAITRFIGGSDKRRLLKAFQGGHPRSIGIHRANQSAADVAASEAIAGTLLADLGYL